ncbi:hypothetical protein IT575_07945 [bacterium]|nr:hypothetical protein [bacterium]
MQRSESEVASGAATVTDASRLLGQIVGAVDALNVKIQAISAAAQQMNASTLEVLSVVESVNELADENAGSAERVSAATEVQAGEIRLIADDADSLSQLSGELHALVKRFQV